MAITANFLTTGSSTLNEATYTTASIAPTANRLVLVDVTVSQTGATPTSPTLSGNSLTFVSVASVLWDTVATPRSRLVKFRAMGAAPTPGEIVIAFGGVSQSGCAWSVTEYAGVNTGGSNGSAAVIQSNTFAGDATTTASVSLAAFGNPSNWTQIAATADNNLVPQLVADTPYTHRSTVNYAGPSQTLSTADYAGQDTLATYASVSTLSMAATAMEIGVATGNLDSRDKRSSGIHVRLPWRGMHPLADGSLNQGDRQHVGTMYRGILAAAPSAPPAAPVTGGWGPLLSTERNSMVVG